MKNKAIRILTLVLALTMVCSLPAFASGEAGREPTEIIADMLAAYQGDPSADLTALKAELTAAEAAQGEAWGKILDYWAWVNTEMTVNRDILPDGLPTDDTLCIIVLGYQLNPDGTMQEELIGRLQVALASAEKYPNAYVACTGGGTASQNPDATEADQMANWLLEQGLDPARIIVENRSGTTVENAEFTYEILRSRYPQIESLALVTSDYHVPRGCVLYSAKLILAAGEAGDKLLTIVDNAGFTTGRAGYESIALQASGLAQIAGVRLNASGEASSDVAASPEASAEASREP